MVFAQVATDEKSNEITAIPKLLDGLPLVNALVSIDAMGCQFKIANLIIAGRGHYLFSLKGNQGSLHTDLQEYYEDARSDGFSFLPHDSATTRETNRGRQETRTIRVFTDLEWLFATIGRLHGHDDVTRLAIKALGSKVDPYICVLAH